MIDLLHIAGLLDARECESIRAQLRSVAGAAAGLRDASRFRKVSAVIFLSAPAPEPLPETYGGGELMLHGPYGSREPPVRADAQPGTLVAFRAETTHEVTPVTHGERFTIVSWYR